MEIRVFDWTYGEFIQRLVTEKATNIKYKTHAYDPSDFNFEFPLGEKTAAVEFKKDRFVLMENFIGVIENIKRASDAGSNMMSVSGIDVKGILSRFEAIPLTFSGIQGTAGFDVTTGYTDACIKHYWRNNIGANAEINRRLHVFEIAEDKNIGNQNDTYMARFQKISDITAELAKGANLVITSTPQIEAGKILIDVAEPDMRTASSDKPLIFSLERQTILQIEHIQEKNSYKNVFYATRSGAQFADEALTLLYMRDGESEPAGLERREQHLNISVNTPIAGDEYIEMRRQAVHNMVNYEDVNVLTAKVNFNQLKMNIDYKVGDFVTLQHSDWNIEADMQIVSVEVSDGAGGRTETATLGSEKKGYIRQIQTEINNI